MNRGYTVQANFQAGSVTTPGVVTAPAAGGTLSIGVTATSGCLWKAETASDWVTLSGSSGTGPGVVTLSVAANTSTAPRSGVISIGDQTVTITQANANAVAVAKVTLYPTSLIGGATTTVNRVALNAPAPVGGATVTLSSSNPIASVPATVVIPGGSTETTFSVVTLAVSETQTAAISASSGGVSQSAALTVRPAALSSVKLYPPAVTGGYGNNNNRVTLDGPAGPGGVVVNLASTDSLLVSVPAQVTVPSGQTYVLFPIATTGVAEPATASITATLAGVTKAAILTVNPPDLKTLTLSPASITGGVVSTSNKVLLNAPAPAGGAVVMLSSSNPSAAAVPASVTVLSGQTYALFPITTASVDTMKPVTISASYRGVITTSDVTVQPPL
jgi:hypothetical protein